jgi:parallel beta-helix repeat protein
MPKRLVIFGATIVVVAMIVLAVVLFSGLIKDPHARGLISIVGNSELTKRNGIGSGTGSASDPYVIGGWVIKPGSTETAIKIVATSGHLVISNITLECDSNSIGIYLEGSSNVRIENCTINGAAMGIIVQRSDNFSVAFNKVNGIGPVFGIDIDESADGDVIGNNVSFEYPMTNNIEVYKSVRTLVRANHMDVGLSIKGTVDSHFSTLNVTPDNIVQGKPVLCQSGKTGLAIDASTLGQVYLFNCTDVEIWGMDVANTCIAVGLMKVTRAVVRDCRAANGTECGMSLQNCTDCVVSNCMLSDSILSISECADCRVTETVFAFRSGGVGSSSNIRFDNNTVRECSVALTLSSADNCTIEHNIFSANMPVLSLWGVDDDILVFNNDFIGNEQQIVNYDGLSMSNITWNVQYPIGGNYWSNYTVADLFGGPNQDVPGADGIGDLPYYLDPTNCDRYPLIEPANS